MAANPPQLALSATNTTPTTKVWTTLITNTKYLTGLLTLEYSLRRVGSKYPLVALYTDTFSDEGHAVLDLRGIAKRRIEYLLPKAHKDYSNDTRFYDCWSKLQPFSLFEYERVVQLDSDMVVLRNMDELMEIPLNNETRVFAAAHACVCNPYNKSHYPSDWTAANCVYSRNHEFCSEYKSEVLTNIASDDLSSALATAADAEILVRGGESEGEGLIGDAKYETGEQEDVNAMLPSETFNETALASINDDVASSSSSSGAVSGSGSLESNADTAATTPPAVLDQHSFLHAYGPGPDKGLGICNGGLQVVQPNQKTYNKILGALEEPTNTGSYDFADQSLLSDVFKGCWVPLSYKYNALKTLKAIHPETWDDSEISNVHYIINPKPWDVRHLPNRLSTEHDETQTFRFWFSIDDERMKLEAEKGITDGY